MKIVLMERNSVGCDIDVSAFSKFGEVISYDYSNPAEDKERILDADIVVANKVKFNAELLDGNDKTKLVCLTATGTNNIDFDYCNSRGITVCNVSGYSTDAVAQHTFAMFFYLMEHLKAYDTYVKDGSYSNAKTFTFYDYKYNELAGKTWGIVGLGAIGRRVADIAKAFGCNVIYYSTSGRNANPSYKQVSFDELLTESDIISIHAPLNNDTKYLFNEYAFSKMRDNAYILNLGRGSIIDENALKDALINKKIRGAGLDVLEVEPLSKTSPLCDVLDYDNLFITPHIGWGPVEARQRVVDECVLNIESYLKGESRNVVK